VFGIAAVADPAYPDSDWFFGQVGPGQDLLDLVAGRDIPPMAGSMDVT
jgi:hypothetical protein